MSGNLNRHKKVKHGLNETTDVMEEDAVNFLSSLSERARDEHMEGETESLSPGSGAEGADGKSGRKGRKSIPRKITQGEGEEVSFSQQTVQGNMQSTGTLKPFVIQNPDTDEEVDDEEDGEVPNPSTLPNSVREASESVAPVTNVMNFQPLNNGGGGEPEPTAQPSKRVRLDEHAELDRRPRRQSQRRSPKVNANNLQQSESDDENGNNDSTDTDWVPGARRRSRGRSDIGDKKN